MKSLSLGSFNEICQTLPLDYYKERVNYWKPKTGLELYNLPSITPKMMQESLKRLAVRSKVFILNPIGKNHERINKN